MIPYPVFQLIDAILQLASFIVVIGVILSWLLAFNVLNRSNRFVDMVWRTSQQLTEPLFRRVRGFMPDFGGVDLSPLVVLLGIWFLRLMNSWIAARIALA